MESLSWLVFILVIEISWYPMMSRNAQIYDDSISILNDKFNFSSGRTVGQFPCCTKPRPLAAVFHHSNKENNES
jgi:hypothetical protein